MDTFGRLQVSLHMVRLFLTCPFHYRTNHDDSHVLKLIITHSLIFTHSLIIPHSLIITQ